MGVNRIVMQNGVVWWLPPLRPKDESRSPSARPSRPRKPAARRASDKPRDAAAAPPPGFIPLSSLGIPGIDSLMLSHADFYRDAYERAIEKGPQAGPDGSTPIAPSDTLNGGTDSLPPAAPRKDSDQGPDAGQTRRPAA